MKHSHGNHFNFNAVLKALLLFGFAAFYLRAVVTGTAGQYVHPRIVPYLIFAAIVMTVIGLLLLAGAAGSHSKTGASWQLIFFALPLLMAFTLPPPAPRGRYQCGRRSPALICCGGTGFAVKRRGNSRGRAD